MYTLLIVPTVVFTNASALPNLLFTFATAKLALNDLALAPNLGNAVFVFEFVVLPVTFNGTLATADISSLSINKTSVLLNVST